MNFPADVGLEMLAAIADEIPVGIWVGRAPRGDFVYANKTFAEITGATPRPGVPADETSRYYGLYTLNGELYPPHELAFTRALREKRTVVTDDTVVHRPDGRRAHLRAFAKPLLGPNGRISHVVLVLIDITQEVQAQQARAESELRLQRAQRMESVGNLAGGIAHDFNNLLATVKVLTSLLRMGESQPTRLDSLQQIDHAVDSGMKLTRALMEFARPRARLERRVSVNQVVRTVIDLVQSTLDRRFEVRCALEAKSDEVLGDASRLEQVVMNLVVNARDAMPQGGTLTLRTWDAVIDEAEAQRRPPLSAGPHVGLEVIDTGVGIDPAIRDRIFEPYFTTKTHGAVKGLGLGLATAHGIVEGHRGAIEVAPSPSPGTVMRALFPVAPADAPRRPEPSRKAELQSGKGLVMLVEDEPALSRASSRVLNNLGYNVVCAVDGVEALEIFQTRGPEIAAVVLDMILPRMDGRQTLQELRRLDPGIPVLVVSGSAVEETQQEMLELGADSFLTKPYDAEELSQVLARIARSCPPA